MQAIQIAFLCAAVSSSLAESPAGLLTDLRPSPALGVPARPTFTWIVPHIATCGTSPKNEQTIPVSQVQAAYQIQVFDASGSVVVDSGHTAGNASVDVVWDFSGAHVLTDANLYAWRVRVWTAPLEAPGNSSCESDWSTNATFVVALTNGFAKTTQPIWADSTANFVYLSRKYTLKENWVAVTAFVSAVGDDHLLGAYRLFADGQTKSIGPGRGDTAYGTDGNIVYDTVDVTPDDPSATWIALGLQCYHSVGSEAGVILELHVHYADGTCELTGGTDATWMAFNANSVYNPSGKEGGYGAPQENIDAGAYPSDGWKSRGEESLLEMLVFVRSSRTMRT